MSQDLQAEWVSYETKGKHYETINRQTKSPTDKASD
jgi:hypothetical protein